MRVRLRPWAWVPGPQPDREGGAGLWGGGAVDGRGGAVEGRGGASGGAGQVGGVWAGLSHPGQQHISDLLDEVATVLPPLHQAIKE